MESAIKTPSISAGGFGCGHPDAGLRQRLRILLCLVPACLLFGWGSHAEAASYTYTTGTFAWHDPIASGDARISNWNNPCTGYCDAIGDDSISASINIGFTFNFAGTNYTQLQIQTDGRVQFNNNYSYYGTQNIGSYGVNPSPPPPFIWSGSNPRQYTLTPLPQSTLNNTMVVYGTDVDVSPNGSGGGPSPTGCSPSSSIPTSGNNYVQGKCGVYYTQLPTGCIPSLTCTQFVVTWLNVPDWGDATSSYNFQVILNKNGTFVYQYNTSVNPEFGQAEVGYQGASTADYVNYIYPGPTSPYSGGIASLAGTAILWNTVPVTTVGKFNAFETSTAAGSATGFINTKVAGSGFTLALVAVNGGVQDSTFTGNVTIDLIGNITTGVTLDTSTNCPNSFSSVLGSFVATITNGRSNIAFAAVPNVWQDVRVRINYAGPPAVTVCSTDNFAIRPSSLTVALLDADWATAGNGRTLTNLSVSGGNVHQAGAPLRVAVTVLPNTATQYNGSPTVVSANCVVLAGMSGCNNGVVALPGGSSWIAGNPLVNDSASYSEAGVFNLVLEDHNFAGVDAPDNEAAAVLTVPQSGGVAQVGRFVPANFFVATTGTAPQFKTFDTDDASCNAGAAAPKRSFTYIGQPFGYVTAPTASVTAVNLSGTQIYNYRGSLWKLGNTNGTTTPGTVKDCTTNPNICNFTTNWNVTGTNPTTSKVVENYTYALIPASTPGWDNNSGAAAAIDVTSAGNGSGTTSYAAGELLAFLRDTTTPTVPFTANIALNVTVQDSSESAVAGNGTITTTGGGATFNGGGTGIAFDSGNEFRYGRLQLLNANGSELLPLSMGMKTQYFTTGAGFVDNAGDNCTTINVANAGLGNYQLNLNAGETTVSIANPRFLGGTNTITLSAPGSGNTGAVDMVVDLGSGTATNTCPTTPALSAAAGANIPYLRDVWYCNGGSYNRDPSARATFGVYSTNQNFIYQRENY